MDREDITSLTGALDDVIDLIHASSSAMVTYNVKKITPVAKQFSEIITSSTKVVSQTLPKLRHRRNFAQVHKAIIEINRLEVVSSAFMAFSHGSNDAQKTMGIITLALIAAHQIPASPFEVPLWVIALSAVAMALGTASRFGFPLSTTHVISSSILGVGSAKRFKSVRWIVAGGMFQAWIYTIPATAAIAFVSYLILTKVF